MSLPTYDPSDIVFDSVVELEDAPAHGFASLLDDVAVPSMLFVFEHTIHAIALLAKIPEGWVAPITEREQAQAPFFAQLGVSARALVIAGFERVLSQYASERLHYFSNLIVILAPVPGRPELRARAGMSILSTTRTEMTKAWEGNRSAFGGPFLRAADLLNDTLASTPAWRSGTIAAPPEPGLQQLAIDVAGLEAAFARAGSFRTFWSTLSSSLRKGIVRELVGEETTPADPEMPVQENATTFLLGTAQCHACGHTVRIRGYPVQGVVSTLSVADCDRDRGTHDVLVQWSAHRG